MATIFLPCWVRERESVYVCARMCACVCVCVCAHAHMHTCAKKGHSLLRPKVYNRPQTQILCLQGGSYAQEVRPGEWPYQLCCFTGHSPPTQGHLLPGMWLQWVLRAYMDPSIRPRSNSPRSRVSHVGRLGGQNPAPGFIQSRSLTLSPPPCQRVRNSTGPLSHDYPETIMSTTPRAAITRP